LEIIVVAPNFCYLARRPCETHKRPQVYPKRLAPPNSAAAKSSNKKPNEGCNFWVTGSAVFEPVREREKFFFFCRCVVWARGKPAKKMDCNTHAGDGGGTQGESAREVRDADSRRKGKRIPDGKGCRFQRPGFQSPAARDAGSRGKPMQIPERREAYSRGKRCRFWMERDADSRVEGSRFHRNRDADSKEE